MAGALTDALLFPPPTSLSQCLTWRWEQLQSSVHQILCSGEDTAQSRCAACHIQPLFLGLQEVKAEVHFLSLFG